MRNMKKLIIMVAAVLVLAGCESRPVEGYVVGKVFIPAHNERRYEFKRRRTRHYPGQWFIWVADSNHVERWQVDRHTFQSLKHGQYVKSKGTYHGKEIIKTQ